MADASWPEGASGIREWNKAEAEGAVREVIANFWEWEDGLLQDVDTRANFRFQERQSERAIEALNRIAESGGGGPEVDTAKEAMRRIQQAKSDQSAARAQSDDLTAEEWFDMISEGPKPPGPIGDPT